MYTAEELENTGETVPNQNSLSTVVLLSEEVRGPLSGVAIDGGAHRANHSGSTAYGDAISELLGSAERQRVSDTTNCELDFNLVLQNPRSREWPGRVGRPHRRAIYLVLNEIYSCHEQFRGGTVRRRPMTPTGVWDASFFWPNEIADAINSSRCVTYVSH